MLKRTGIAHEVLNAKYHEREAAIIAQAGRKGAVTVATNMAGRGTDIMLGGNPDFIADLELHQRGLSPVETPDDFEAAWPEAVEKARRAVEAEHSEVVAAGGLYVLGTERHESRRIDNQLRGRSGRQGDPGVSRFYLSLEDDLMRMFNADKVAHFMEWLKTPPDVPIESKAVSRSIRSAQTQVEQQNFEIRKDLLKYDDVMNRQRHVVYDERRRVLEGADLQEQIRGMINEVVAGYVRGATAEGVDASEWDLDQLWRAFAQLYPSVMPLSKMVEEAGGERTDLDPDFIIGEIQQDAQAAYDRRTEELTPELMRELERRVVLSVLDRKWREHLYEMDYLRDGIGLRAWAQRDPLVEYQREGFEMFNAMMEGIKEESVGNLFNLQVQVQEDPIVAESGGLPRADLAGAGLTGPGLALGGPQLAGPELLGPELLGPPAAQPDAAQGGNGKAAGSGKRRRGGGAGPGSADGAAARGAGRAAAAAGAVEDAVPAGGKHRQPIPPALAGRGLEAPQRPGRLEYTAPATDGSGTAEHRSSGTAGKSGPDYSKVGRNAPCPCGSGKKFKQCHGDPRNR